MANRLTYKRDVLQPVEKENYAGEEQQMVVAGDHVLGAEIGEGQEVRARDLPDVALVTFRDAVGVRGAAE